MIPAEQFNKEKNKETELDLASAFTAEKPRKRKAQADNNRSKDKKFVIFLTIGIVGLVGGIACFLVGLLGINNIVKVPAKIASFQLARTSTLAVISTRSVLTDAIPVMK